MYVTYLYSEYVVNKWTVFFIFKHSWAPKRSWKISRGVLESPGFFVSKRVGTLLVFMILRCLKPILYCPGRSRLALSGDVKWSLVFKRVKYAVSVINNCVAFLTMQHRL